MAKEKEKKVREKINWKKEFKLAPGYIVIILWVIFTFMLLGWILAASLSTTADIFAGKALKFPTGLHFENYAQAWGSGGVATFFMNSLLYALVSCVLLILICAPAAYVLSRFTFLGNKVIQTSFVSAMGIPITMIVLPLFSIVANMGILNNVFASKITLIFLYIGINIPYTTIFLLTFFSNLSRTYEEAAAIDGCPPTKTFWKIMFPMAQSGLVTVTIFNFINICKQRRSASGCRRTLRNAPVHAVHRKLVRHVRGSYHRIPADIYPVHLPVREDYRRRYRRHQGLVV